MSEAASPESGPLSVEQAIASLTPAEPVEREEAAPVEAGATEEPQGETSAPEEPDAAPEQPAEEDEAKAEPEAVAPVDPPRYWSQDAKAKFAELPPELQAVVLQQEGPREEATAKAKAEAAAKIQAADAEMGKVAQLAQSLAEFLPQAIQTFTSRWGTNPDWVAYAQEHGVEAMTLAKTQHEAELSLLQQASVAKQQAEVQAHTAFVKAEAQKLAELAPELVDPEKGQERRTEIAKYLIDQGIPADAIKSISAVEMNLARKARLYDLAQAAVQAAPRPKPTAPVAKAPVRPAAAVPQTSQQRTASQVANRFAQTRSVDDAVALLLTKKA
jgi:hypothetical protein